MLTAIVHLKLFRRQDGGRSSAIRTGYRPNIRFGDLYTDASFCLIDREEVYPGEECKAKLTFVNPLYVSEFLTEGSLFQIHEGQRHVGEGRIVTLL